MKKIALLTSLFAISLSAVACVGEAGDDSMSPGDDEVVGEADQALDRSVTVGSLGWTDQAGPSSDLIVTHTISGTSSKWVTLDMLGTFPSLNGAAATTDNINKCKMSYLDVWVSKRDSVSDPWTQLYHQMVYGKATVSNGVITSCTAYYGVGDCDAIGFPASQYGQVKVELANGGPLGYFNPKTSLARYQSLNLANCP